MHCRLHVSWCLVPLLDSFFDGWEKSWESGVTPWDLGKPTPIIEHLVKSGTLPKGRALVPGCGMGYDVVALASPERFVFGLEISNIAAEKAKQWSSSLLNADCFTFLVADFFKWRPSEPFDLIFDYTFFCALDPSLRLAWAETVSRLLKPDGELITLIYLVHERDRLLRMPSHYFVRNWSALHIIFLLPDQRSRRGATIQ